jgi:S-adenosylmethionine:tRNA ribosyltransferase-isomerase
MGDADLYEYDLPRELIAQEPLADRPAARLLHLHRRTGIIAHRRVRDLPDILRAGDLLVVNDTQVLPARLRGRRLETGGAWEGLFLRAASDEEHPGAWVILAQTRGRMHPGERIVLRDRSDADAGMLHLVGRTAGGGWLAMPDEQGPFAAILARVGHVPLPGYIRKGMAVAADIDRYQTIFAREPGSAAAPTAGLHFTPELLTTLAERGVHKATVTLHVGLDTFRPISTESVAEHPMHSEWCACPAETVAAIREAKARGGRVVAVGTTAVRTLETAARAGGVADSLVPWSGTTDLFIRPGFDFRVVDCLLTNFHMPRTTLMVLVCTFASQSLIEQAYAVAIQERYRFLSYGDAMLID